MGDLPAIELVRTRAGKKLHRRNAGAFKTWCEVMNGAVDDRRYAAVIPVTADEARALRLGRCAICWRV